MSEPLTWKLKQPLRHLTAPLRLLPDFLIAGVQKGGTTSLYNYLIQHPAVMPANIKEPHFFDKRYRHGMRWYRAQFPTGASRRRLSKELGEQPLCGEATPYSLFHPRVAERIAHHLPEARTIILLRNPSERAYSHYQHEVRAGRETLSFEEAIEREPERLRGEEERLIAEPHYNSYNHRKYSYLARGHYAGQLERWFRHIPRERTLILQSEELFANPEAVYAQVLNYLELSPQPLQNFKKFNSHPYSKIAPATRERLVNYYRPLNERLYQLLGREFDWR